MNSSLTRHADFDVAIVGAGPVGLAFAGWLVSVWGEQANRIAIFDSKSLDNSVNDPRVLALSEATRFRLAGLGFPSNATPIHQIHISEQFRFGRVCMSADELGLCALGWTVRYGDLVRCLSSSLERSGVKIFRSTKVKQVHHRTSDSLEVLTTEGGAEYTVNLRVDAEGGLYGEVAERDVVIDYNQWALVCEVTLNLAVSLKNASNTLAFERFTPEGPLALLPISQDQRKYSLVWCAPKSRVQERLVCAEAELIAELHRQLGRRVFIEQIGPRKAFPLGMNQRSKLVQGRRVFIGNAAQILHPVAGQGLNLGLRDAMQLCDVINPWTVAQEHRLNLALNAFDQSREADRRMVVKMTDCLVKMFSNRNPLFGAGRQMALNLMEFTPPLRRQFAEMMLFGLVI
jgi:2-octaprenyl-6-methoxyphenol hydroxylase